MRRDVGESPLIAKSDRILTTISIGVVTCNVAMTGIADLMRAADQTLYDAKGGGRNRVVCSIAAGSIPAHRF
jgi:diguanylate cyclase (GGDEF)-like protein